jgi:hypothetical protein
MIGTDTITCPLCSTEGWPSSLRTEGYSAKCGTTWDMRGYYSQAETCQIIAGLRFQIDLLQLQGVAS